jgi:hypothetical protein
MSLNEKEKEQILRTIRKRVLKNHFNVAGVNYEAWARSFDSRSTELLSADSGAFETIIQDLLRELGSSHTGFYYERPNRQLPQHAINATLGKFVRGRNDQWFFLDVFEDGPAELAGISSR